MQFKVQILSTFQQNPVSMAAAIAVLDVLKEEAPPSHVEAIGNEIRAGFEKLAEKYPVVGNIRGRGCMQGIEFVKDRETKEPFVELMTGVFEETKDRGLLIGAGGVKSAFRFTPPLVCQKEHVATAVEILHDAIGAGLKTQSWAN